MPKLHQPVAPNAAGPATPIDVKIVAILLVLNSIINLALVVAVLLGIIPRLGVVMRPPLSYIGRYGFYALTILLQSLQMWVGLGLWKRKRSALKLGIAIAAGNIVLFYFTNLWGNIPINAILAAYFLYLYSKRPDFAKSRGV